MLKIISIIVVVALLIGAATAGAQALYDGGDIKNNSLTGKDIRNKSLTQQDFRGSVQGARGPRGFSGPQGAAGPQGPPGPTALGQITVVTSAQAFFGPSDLVKSATAFCPAGQRAVSGGGASVSDEQIAITEAAAGRSGWTVVGVDLVDNGGEYVQAQALCAPQNQAVAAGMNRARVRSQVAKLVAKVEAQYAGVSK
jgi:hypothetical protein